MSSSCPVYCPQPAASAPASLALSLYPIITICLLPMMPLYQPIEKSCFITGAAFLRSSSVSKSGPTGMWYGQPDSLSKRCTARTSLGVWLIDMRYTGITPWGVDATKRQVSNTSAVSSDGVQSLGISGRREESSRIRKACFSSSLQLA